LHPAGCAALGGQTPLRAEAVEAAPPGDPGGGGRCPGARGGGRQPEQWSQRPGRL